MKFKNTLTVASLTLNVVILTTLLILQHDSQAEFSPAEHNFAEVAAHKWCYFQRLRYFTGLPDSEYKAEKVEQVMEEERQKLHQLGHKAFFDAELLEMTRDLSASGRWEAFVELARSKVIEQDCTSFDRSVHEYLEIVTERDREEAMLNEYLETVAEQEREDSLTKK